MSYAHLWLGWLKSLFWKSESGAHYRFRKCAVAADYAPLSATPVSFHVIKYSHVRFPTTTHYRTLFEFSDHRQYIFFWFLRDGVLGATLSHMQRRFKRRRRWNFFNGMYGPVGWRKDQAVSLFFGKLTADCIGESKCCLLGWLLTQMCTTRACCSLMGHRPEIDP